MPSKIIKKREKERDIQCGGGIREYAKESKNLTMCRGKRDQAGDLGIARAGEWGAIDYLIAGSDISPYMS
jgi:hypothetical protein